MRGAEIGKLNPVTPAKAGVQSFLWIVPVAWNNLPSSCYVIPCRG